MYKIVHDDVNIKDKNIIFFDGVCNLCDGFVQFVIKRDKNQHFRFASLQSTPGEQLIKKMPNTGKKLDSILLYTNGEVYSQSSAVLKIMKQLSGGWPMMSFFFIIPKPVRDFVYKFVAANRYKWFGKKDQCMIPTPELKKLFVD